MQSCLVSSDVPFSRAANVPRFTALNRLCRMQAPQIFLNGRRIVGVDAGGLWPPLILEIMMLAKRRNDDDDNAIRRHFDSSLKAQLSCSLVAEGFA